MKFSKLRKLLSFFSIILIALFCTLLFPLNKPVLSQGETEVYVSNYRAGALIPFTSTQDPTINLRVYNTTGQAQVILYQANKDTLLKNLIHDKDNNQLNKSVDVSNLQQIADQTVQLNSSSDTFVSLPLSKSGIWVLRVILNNKNYDYFLTRSDNGILVKQEDNRYIFWAQNFKTLKSTASGNLKLYSMLNGQKELVNTSFDNQGIAETAFFLDADIGIAKFGSDEVIFPVNLHNLNTQYDYKTFKDIRKTKYFVFTDRPLYKPGDTVYFKAIIRDDYDAEYSIPQGLAMVKITKDYDSDNPITTKDFSVSSDGTISGKYKISPDSPTGYFEIRVEIPTSVNKDSGYAQFQIDYYRKPEYSLDLTTDKLELIMGDKSSAKVFASYFFGQPVTDQKVKYQIITGNLYEYEFQNERASSLISDWYSYGYASYGGKIYKGDVVLDKKGQSNINFEAKIPKNNALVKNFDYKSIEGKNQIFSIETLLDDGSGNPSFRKKNIIVYAGEFDIFRKEANYAVTVGEQINLPLVLIPHFKAQVSDILLISTIHRENWISYQEPNKKFPSYNKEEEDLPTISATSDKDGNATFNLVPQKPGSYQLTVSGNDKRGNVVKKTFYIYVSSTKDYYNFRDTNSSITISSDKKNYLPQDTAKLTVYSNIPDTDILLSMERGRVHRFQVIHMQGNSAILDVLLEESDIPNISARASSFVNDRLEEDVVDLPVSAESKRLKVSLKTDKERYGPSETVQVDVESKDTNGNPTTAEIAVWAVDKALYELSDSKPEDIFQFFWQTRYDSTSSSNSLQGIGIAGGGGGGGCFLPDTQILMQDGKTKRIDQIKIGDYVETRVNESDSKLIKAKVLGIHKVSIDGYLILNSSLKVTPNHKIRVNNSWKDAGSIQIGDFLTDDKGKYIPVVSIEYQKGKVTVYNLEVEKYHTFFADSIFVHNQKGVMRDVFEDTAYWNPSVRTDSSGHARLTFTLPDNLTTWELLAVGSTTKTQVGHSKIDILVQKDVFIRPILPNILRTQDSAMLSAIVHNFTNLNQSLEVKLESQNLKIAGNQPQSIALKPSESIQVYWPITAQVKTDEEKLTFSVKSKKDNKLLDAATVSLPIRQFGFFEKEVAVGQGSLSFPIKLSQIGDPARNKITLDLSPTILGPILTSMQYLISYPYGCVEQTTSRLLAALVTKLNPQLFGNALAEKNLDQIVNQELKKLTSLQSHDGSFSWWQNGKADYFVTSYVVGNVILAKSLNFSLGDEILKNAQRYLEQENNYNYRTNMSEPLTESQQVARTYVLSLLNLPKDKIQISVTNPKVTPDILSLVVLTNIQNGFKDPNTNGLNKLLSLAKIQGDVQFFEAGLKENFGSTEASTALAIQAMIAGGIGQNEITPYVRFLVNGRRADYFANTYATSQTIRALSEFAKLGDETNPNFSYTVNLDAKSIQTGKFTDFQTLNQKFDIPLGDVKANSNLTIQQNGAGQLYSTLTLESFNTQKNAPAKDSGLSIKRDYLNSKGQRGKIAVGDTIEVRLSVSGPATDDFYAVIKDELPAGLVPVNASLNNEQFYSYSFEEPSSSPSATPTPSIDDFAAMETTENGVILSVYKISKGNHTYKYKARAVTEGSFAAPPAQIELMYNPTVSGRSNVNTITIGGVSPIDNLRNVLITAAAVVIAGAAGVFIFRKLRSREI